MAKLAPLIRKVLCGKTAKRINAACVKWSVWQQPAELMQVPRIDRPQQRDGLRAAGLTLVSEGKE